MLDQFFVLQVLTGCILDCIIRLFSFGWNTFCGFKILKFNVYYRRHLYGCRQQFNSYRRPLLCYDDNWRRRYSSIDGLVICCMSWAVAIFLKFMHTVICNGLLFSADIMKLAAFLCVIYVLRKVLFNPVLYHTSFPPWSVLLLLWLIFRIDPARLTTALQPWPFSTIY